MARPLGAQNKDKPFRVALQMEIAAAGESLRSLRNIAQVLLDRAAAGEINAIQEVANRLDGKPAQAVLHSGSEEGTPVETKVTVSLE